MRDLEGYDETFAPGTNKEKDSLVPKGGCCERNGFGFEGNGCEENMFVG